MTTAPRTTELHRRSAASCRRNVNQVHRLARRRSLSELELLALPLVLLTLRAEVSWHIMLVDIHATPSAHGSPAPASRPIDVIYHTAAARARRARPPPLIVAPFQVRASGAPAAHSSTQRAPHSALRAIRAPLPYVSECGLAQACMCHCKGRAIEARE